MEQCDPKNSLTDPYGKEVKPYEYWGKYFEKRNCAADKNTA